MKRAKIIQQLESELATANRALGDSPSPNALDYTNVQEPAFYDGYWVGRQFGLRQALTLLKGKELNHE